MQILSPMIYKHKIGQTLWLARINRYLISIALVTMLLAGLNATVADRIGKGVLKQELDALLLHETVHGAKISLGIYPVKGNQSLFEYNSSLQMIPASLQKLMTAVTAIRRWGLDHRFRTRLGYRGEIRDSVLYGDLVIIADGDPSWSESIHPEGGHIIFEQWADSLKARGIGRIEGKLIVNTDKFDFQRRGDGWEKDDEPYGYAAPISPFSFNENAIGFDLVAPDTLNTLVRITPRFGYSYLTLENHLRSAPAHTMRNIVIKITDVAHYRLIQGTMPMGTQRTVRASVSDPVDFAVSMLRDAFAGKGLHFSGKYGVDDVKPDTVVMQHLFDYESVELIHILRFLLKDSSNMMSEMLLHQFGRGVKDGISYMKMTLKDIGIDSEKITIADGSGLSRKNQVSAKQIGQLLVWCHDQPWFEQFYNAQAVNGIDGTLKNRLNQESVRGRIHAKTGSLTGVNTLAGYLRAADEQLYVLVIMCLGYKSAVTIMDWQDSICQLLLRYDGTMDAK